MRDYFFSAQSKMKYELGELHSRIKILERRLYRLEENKNSFKKEISKKAVDCVVGFGSENHTTVLTDNGWKEIITEEND